jgi:hypothetical protein
MGESTVAQDRGDSQTEPRKGRWSKLSIVVGSSTAFVAGAAGLATGLVAIADTFPKFIPFLAPFDASILVRDIRVPKATLTESTFNSSTAVPAVDLDIEYVEEKTGASRLNACHTELELEEVYLPAAWPSQSHVISEQTQAIITDKFIVRREHFAESGALRIVCDKRVTSWKAFALPHIAGAKKPETTTYHVCRGEHQSGCGATPNWVPCSTEDIAGWVKRTHPAECVKVEEPKRISDVKGNRCGYATFRVRCSTR